MHVRSAYVSFCMDVAVGHDMCSPPCLAGGQPPRWSSIVINEKGLFVSEMHYAMMTKSMYHGLVKSCRRG